MYFHMGWWERIHREKVTPEPDLKLVSMDPCGCVGEQCLWLQGTSREENGRAGGRRQMGVPRESL